MAPRGRPRVRSIATLQPQLESTHEDIAVSMPDQDIQVPTPQSAPIQIPVQPEDATTIRQLLDLLCNRTQTMLQQEARLRQIERRMEAMPEQPHPCWSTPPPRTMSSRRHRSPPRRKRARHSPPRRSRHQGSGLPPSTPPTSPDGTYWPEETPSRTSSLTTSYSRERSRSRVKTHKRPRRRSTSRRSPARRDRRDIYLGDGSPRNSRWTSNEGPFSRKVDDCPIPRALEKLPDLKTYDGTGDPDRHLAYFSVMMRYRGAREPVHCKIFPLTLTDSALAWFQELKPNSVSSWGQLATMFTTRFAASRMKPKSEEVLRAIRQGEKETLREYLERFNKEAGNVRNLEDKRRLFWMKDGLTKGSLFQRDVGINKPRSLDEFLQKAQKYMDYEEDNMAYQEEAKVGSKKDELAYKAIEEPWRKRAQDDRAPRESRPRQGRFSKYTLLNTSQAEILAECADAEFRDIKQPEPLVQRKGQTSKKYCRYHKSYGHSTNKCNTLRDDIEEMIREGKLAQYVNEEDDETHDSE